MTVPKLTPGLFTLSMETNKRCVEISAQNQNQVEKTPIQNSSHKD